MLSPVALAALSALSAPALAGVEDVVLDLKITEPMGTPIIEGQFPLPFRQEERLYLGGEEYVLTVTAELYAEGKGLSGSTVTVTALVTRLDGVNQIPTRVASPSVVLTQDQRKTATALVPVAKPVTGADGQALHQLRFVVEGAWSEGARELVSVRDRRQEPVATGLTVLAWSDAPLYTQPGGYSMRLRPAEALTLEAPNAVIAWQVLEDQGEFLRVKSLTPRDSRDHCFGSTPLFADMDLRVWIRREELLLLTRTSATMEYSDGTASLLSAGVPLLPVPGQALFGHPAFHSVANGLHFTIGLPDYAIGLGYEPLRGAVALADRPQRVAVDASGSVGRSASGAVRPVAKLNEVGATLFTAPGVSPATVVVGGACGEHRVKVDLSRVSTPPPAEADFSFGEAGAEAAPPAGELFELGEVLYGPDGSKIGVMLRDHTFRVSPTRKGDLSCIDLSQEGALMGLLPTPDALMTPVLLCRRP
ncbi:hypothetical protein L6R46_18930 [Myxococcota bacterium]|nr:hypothetical protein [Myxococcota bacterium]